jgi:DNA-binding PadR family transcriptional regulator
MPKRRPIGILEYHILALLLEAPRCPEDMALSENPTPKVLTYSLRRMAAKSWIRVQQSEPVRGGNRRRTFAITSAGKLAHQSVKTIFGANT